MYMSLSNNIQKIQCTIAAQLKLTVGVEKTLTAGELPRARSRAFPLWDLYCTNPKRDHASFIDVWTTIDFSNRMVVRWVYNYGNDKANEQQYVHGH